MKVQVSVSIDVPDMETATQFYSKALGCKSVRTGAKISVLSAENMTIYLLKKDAGSNPLLKSSAVRKYDRHWTPVHLDFNVSDLDQALSSILEFGGTHEGSETGDWGAIAYCADPFGHGFCLVKS